MLASQIPPDWRKALASELEKPYFKELEKYLADERKKHTVLPPPEKIFAALRRTPLAKVKVVLLGQDPYPTSGCANGLSFSVPAGRPIPASLKNLFEVAKEDVGIEMPDDGDLAPWADQGVLLLNTVLTVREGEPNSHKARGWERFTKAMLEKVNAQDERVVFLLLGKQAQQVAAGIDTTRHAVVATPHPSPATPGNPFGKTRPFSRVNDALRQGGRTPIDWQIPRR
jgi:uracil-DNA glycosylase